MPLFLRAPEALCLIRLSAIGDCVHAVAMVQAIQRQWPQTKITWIMGKAEASLLHDLPGIEVIVFDKAAGLRAYTSIWKQLRDRRFDALLHMQSALRASLLTLGIKANKTLGFDQQRTGDGQALFTNYKVPSPQSPHVLDGFMAFAAELGVQDLTPQWHIPITEADNEWAKQTISSKKPTLLIAPSASKAYKNWTKEGYAALADHAVIQGFDVILCGGPAAQEKQFADEISALCQHKPVNLVGQTTLKRLLALIKHDGRKIIPHSENAFRLMWEKRKATVGLNNLHFHDTRHEAITRMVRVRKLPVEVLAKITGHKKIDVLVNTYYNPNADDLIDAFNRQN